MLECHYTTDPQYNNKQAKSSMVPAQNRYEDQWNRIEDLDMNPHGYAHLIFDKGAKNIQRKIASSTNVAGKSGYLPAEN
jgi:hypothetical protein